MREEDKECGWGRDYNFKSSFRSEGLAEKMTFEQSYKGGKRARHAGEQGRACQADYQVQRPKDHNVPSFKKEQGLCG